GNEFGLEVENMLKEIIQKKSDGRKLDSDNNDSIWETETVC
ncbi:21485_t:CDS:1, partial [Gigaspora rosea]